MEKDNEVVRSVGRGRHCIIGDDFKPSCIYSNCRMLEACLKEHYKNREQNG